MRQGTPPDPPRLIDDPTTPEQVRRALRQVAGMSAPIDVVSGLARLERSIAAGGGASPGIGGAGAGAGVVGAITGGSLALLILAGLGIWAGSRDGGSEEPEGAPIRVSRVAPATPAPSDETVSATAPAATASADHAVTPEASMHSGAVEAGPQAPRVTPGSKAQDEAALARELAELAAARRILPDDPARALALLERGRRAYGARSLLAEEREALTILALAALEREPEARSRGQRFLARHPQSAFAERVRRAIATDRDGRGVWP